MASPPVMDLVVARYREDLRWLRRVPRAFRVHLYDKGGDAAGGVTLPNVGREAHTYLHHLVACYETLADLTVFVQGKPFDHVPDLHQRLKAWAAGQETVQDFRGLGFLVDADDRTGSRLFQAWSKNPGRIPLDMTGFWTALFDEQPVPEQFVFFGGAHFAVTRKVIQERPRAFYEKALRVAEHFPDAAHCFERTWPHVFGQPALPPELRGRPLPFYLKPVRRLMDAGPDSDVLK